MLSSRQAAMFRRTADQFLPDTADIRRPQTASDGAGGTKTTWQTVATTPCRIGAVSSSDERVVGAQVAAQASYTLSVPAGTDVRNTDRLQVGSRLFDVKAVLRRGDWELTTRVVCAEV